MSRNHHGEIPFAANQELENCFDAEKLWSENTLKFDVQLMLDHCTSPVEFESDSANSDVAPAGRSYNICADVRKFPSWFISCVSSWKLVEGAVRWLMVLLPRRIRLVLVIIKKKETGLCPLMLTKCFCCMSKQENVSILHILLKPNGYHKKLICAHLFW